LTRLSAAGVSRDLLLSSFPFEQSWGVSDEAKLLDSIRPTRFQSDATFIPVRTETRGSYIKRVDEKSVEAMDKLEAGIRKSAKKGVKSVKAVRTDVVVPVGVA
jgi:hypothetical protein